MKNLYLIGFMGAEKHHCESACEKCPSKRIEMISSSKQQGKAITDIFAAHGENYFRDLETEVVAVFLREHRICGFLRWRQCTQG